MELKSGDRVELLGHKNQGQHGVIVDKGIFNSKIKLDSGEFVSIPTKLLNYVFSSKSNRRRIW